MADITQERIDEVLERPSDFGYWGGNDEMFETWTLGPVIRTRDSSLLEQSNADALEKSLADAVEAGKFSDEDFEITGANHWAVGWVDHLSFRAAEGDEWITSPRSGGSVYREREATAIFHWITEWFDALSDYPVADEEDFSRREWEYALEAMDDMFGSKLRDDVPDDWKHNVMDQMSEYPREDYWNEEEAFEIARSLGYLDEDD